MKDKDLGTKLTALHEIIDLPQHNNAMVVGEALMEIIKSGGTLPRAEKILHDIKSRVRLIGLPMRVYGPQFVSQLPGKEKDHEYGLWVCMNGSEELKTTLKNFKLGPTDVDMTLEETGFLIVGKKGS